MGGAAAGFRFRNEASAGTRPGGPAGAQRATPSGKPSTQDFTGVARVVIAVRDLQASIKRYRDAYALPAPVEQSETSFGARLASFAGTPIVLATPSNPQSWLAARISNTGEGPSAFILHARNAKSYRVTSKGTWFGAPISWLDTGKTGWWLGFE